MLDTSMLAISILFLYIIANKCIAFRDHAHTRGKELQDNTSVMCVDKLGTKGLEVKSILSSRSLPLPYLSCAST